MTKLVYSVYDYTNVYSLLISNGARELHSNQIEYHVNNKIIICLSKQR
jgi:hypothetical protein